MQLQSCPNIRPVTDEEHAEIQRWLDHVEKVVVPKMIDAITQRERNAVEARKIFIR